MEITVATKDSFNGLVFGHEFKQKSPKQRKRKRVVYLMSASWHLSRTAFI